MTASKFFIIKSALTEVNAPKNANSVVATQFSTKEDTSYIYQVEFAFLPNSKGKCKMGKNTPIKRGTLKIFAD